MRAASPTTEAGGVGEAITGDLGDAQMGDGGSTPTGETTIGDRKTLRGEAAGDVDEAAGEDSRRFGGRPLFLFSAELFSLSEFNLEEELGLAGVWPGQGGDNSEMTAGGGGGWGSGGLSSRGRSGTAVGEDMSTLILGGLPLFLFGGGLPVSEESSDRRSRGGL